LNLLFNLITEWRWVVITPALLYPKGNRLLLSIV
jgi:hypothetical protein